MSDMSVKTTRRLLPKIYNATYRIFSNATYVCTLIQIGHSTQNTHHTHLQNIKLLQNPNPKNTTPHRNGGYTKFLNLVQYELWNMTK